MSYSYSVIPVASISGNNLRDLKLSLGVTRDDDAVKALAAQGFTSFVEFTPDDDGHYVPHVDVVHFGKISEHEGIDGIVRAFRKLIDFTGNRVAYGDYEFTDEFGSQVEVTVMYGLSIVHC